MSEIQEQIKLAHKRAEENDIKLLQEEIKEIIGLNCEEEIEVKYFAKDDSLAYKTMDYSELLDYIINLQEENERLKEQFDLVCKISEERKNKWLNLNDENEDLFNIIKDYKSRNEKAIEYIKKEEKANPDSNRKDVGLILMNYKRVLNILQGVNKE